MVQNVGLAMLFNGVGVPVAAPHRAANVCTAHKSRRCRRASARCCRCRTSRHLLRVHAARTGRCIDERCRTFGMDQEVERIATNPARTLSRFERRNSDHGPALYTSRTHWAIPYLSAGVGIRAASLPRRRDYQKCRAYFGACARSGASHLCCTFTPARCCKISPASICGPSAQPTRSHRPWQIKYAATQVGVGVEIN